MNRCFRALLVLICTLSAAMWCASAQAQSYQMDILSRDFYPQLRDSWMFRINNQGVAAGYIATQSSGGSYLPTTYTGGGQFHPFGIESSYTFSIVTGINDQGVVAGNLTDPDFNTTPFIYRNGNVETFTPPADLLVFSLDGINNADMTYGTGFNLASNALEVFTLRDGRVESLPISAPGMFNFQTGSKRLSDTGLLAVIGSSEDESVFLSYLYDTQSGSLNQAAVPEGFATSRISQVTGSGLIFGQASSADGAESRFGFWNADGTFRNFLDVPVGTSGVLINNLGQAIGLNAGHVLLFDGMSWNEREVLGLNGYRLSRINDFNDRGQFVGLARNPQGTFLWGYVASPVPEPSAVLVLGMGSVGLGIYVRGVRRRAASTAEGSERVRPARPHYEAKVWAGWLGLCAVLVLPAGCGSGSGGNGITREALIGSWVLRSMTLEGRSPLMCPGELQSPSGFTLTCDANQIITFNTDGTAQTQNASGAGGSTWTLNGSTLTVGLPPEPGGVPATTTGTARISGGQLILTTPSGFPTIENTPLITVYDKTTTPPPPVGQGGGGGGIGGGGNNGGGGIGGSSRPISDYVGTWSGSWSAPGSMFPLSQPQNGTLALTFDASGSIFGNIFNTTTGQSAAVSGQLTVENGQTPSVGDATFTLGSTPGSFGSQFTLGMDGKLSGSVFVPAMPGDDPMLVNASAFYSLSRQ